MAYQLEPTTDLFQNDQRPYYEALYFDTTCTAVRVGTSHADGVRDTAIGQGVTISLFDLLDANFNPSSKAALDAALEADAPETRSILGYDGDDAITGVVPNVYQYWGAGAPPGCTIAKRVLLKYTGVIPETLTTATLVAAGRGQVRVYRNGTLLFGGALREPAARAPRVGLTLDTIKANYGYQFNSTPTTLTAGDLIEVYYWHNGEPWGGIGMKLLLGTVTAADFLPTLRDAAVVGGSIFAQSTTPLAGVPLNYIVRADLSLGKERIPQLQLTVPIVSDDEPTGYRVSRIDGVKVLRDNADLDVTIQRGRIIHFRSGTLLPDGTPDLYPRYLWFIRDIDQPSNTEAVLQCEGIQSLLAEAFDENYPDYLDYQLAGYVMREGSTEPVFGVPALDNWPLEVATSMLCSRAGFDALTLGLPVRNSQNAGRRVYLTRDETIPYYGIRHLRARSLAAGNHIPLERQSNYGNVPPLASENLPVDDAYLFKPEVTRRVFDRLREMTGQLGYDFGETPDGFVFLRGRNNPNYWQSCAGPGPYAAFTAETGTIALSAVQGPVFYRTSASSAWTRQFSGMFSRIDLYVGVGRDATDVNGGRLNVVIERQNAAGTYVAMSSFTVSTFVDTEEKYFYDDAIRYDGTNAAVIKLGTYRPDQYRVTISPAGPEPGEGSCVYRLNGVAVYEYDSEASLFDTPTTQRVLSSLGNILSLQPESVGKDQLNHVVVVGARRAVVTDSAKFDSTQNNPEREFNVAIGTDPFSIYDPTAPNFLGHKRMSVIFDEKVSDTDFARWLVRTLLYRYKTPSRDGAKFDHTALPVLEPGDALRVKEERHESINHTIYVDEISESYSMEEATSSVSGNPFPAISSYQPREDIDIDTYFQDPVTGKGLPVIGVEITYRNLYDRPVSNVNVYDAPRIVGFASRDANIPTPMVTTALPTGITSIALPQAAIPETVFLSQYTTLATALTGADGIQVRSRGLVNNPYRQFWRISSWTSDGHPTLMFDFQEGDGTAGLYDTTYYNFPTADWRIHYDYLPTRIGGALEQMENPYYDPYSSELGNLVDISFDLLVSGRVRASLWAFSNAYNTDIPVAWLTNPYNDPEKPDTHWAFMDAGVNKSFSWDGIDSIGLWNTLNSAQWSETIKGVFGERPSAVGKGFYAWNDHSSNTHTLIGDVNVFGGTRPNLAPNGKPYFTIGQFGQFYVKIEVLNDALVAKDMDPEQGVYEPRSVTTKRLVTDNAWNSAPAAYVWTHLGEPSQVATRIQDYLGTNWVPGLTVAEESWSAYSTPNADASFAEGTPVRITYVPRPRPGVAFASDGTNTSVKLTRSVHLKTTTFDQFVTVEGSPYKGSSDPKIQQPPVSVGKKRVTSRMFHNEDHTLEFEDSDYRTGEALGSFSWIFDPVQFKKDFGNGVIEPLRFGVYEQLETLPGYNPQALGGTSVQARSSMLMAFMTYLFYFSSFTQDRSGRRQWCLDSWTDGSGNKRGFIDRSKIVTPSRLTASNVPGAGTYQPYAIVDYEDKGAATYYPRTMFVRQWKEAYWSNPSDPRSPAHSSRYNITDTFQRAFVSPLMRDLDLETTALTTGSSTNEDAWIKSWDTLGSTASGRIMKQAAAGSNPITLAIRAMYLASAGLANCRPTAFGTWNFDRTGFSDYFLPSPKRDFYPYRRYPFVPDTSYLYPNFPNLSSYGSPVPGAGMQVLSSTGGMARERLRDPAAKEDWYGWAYSHASGNFGRGPMLECSVEEAAADGASKLTSLGFGFVSTFDEWNSLYDYIRSDRTDRWDQFRGVLSRGPFFKRDTTRWDITWASKIDGAYPRAASPQPVKAAGVYLLNAIRYVNYILAPPTIDMTTVLSKYHYTDYMHEFYDFRFQHEYTWYSDRYFPVYRGGSPMYMYKGNEFTRIRENVPFPWVFLGGDQPRIYYDPGAWTGWKPDIPIGTTTGYTTSWSSAPYLRWREVRASRQRNLADDLGPMDTYVTLTGGEPGMGSGRSQVTISDHGQMPNTGPNVAPYRVHRRTNILDEYHIQPTFGPRLAVGPDLPEARRMTMHLTLSDTYRGL